MPTWRRALLRAIGSGLVGYAAARILIAAGVPVDRWSIAAGRMVHTALTSKQAIWWLTAGCGVLLFGLSYALDPLWARLRAWRSLSPGSAAPNRIGIVFGTGGGFDTYEDKIHIRRHSVHIRLENRSPSRSLTDCGLTLAKISGSLGQRCPVKSETAFRLDPGASEYVPIASFDETISGPPASRPGTIQVHFPINLLANGESYLGGEAAPYDLSLTATAAQSAPHTQRCRLWIDRSGNLRLAKLGR